MSTRRRIRVLTVLCMATWLQAAGGQIIDDSGLPSIEQIENEISQFQEFFKHRFPDTPLQAYNNGAYSLAQSAQRRESWKMLSVLPPYEHDVFQARALWTRNFSNGLNLDDCFGLHPPANRFPYSKQGRVITAESAINECRTGNGENALKLSGGKLAALVAVFRERSNGEPLTVSFQDTQMRRMYVRGRQEFWARRGQNNFSCASCHVDNAGNRLRGDVISAGLGHPAPFPLFSPARESSGTEDAWITLHDQYAACFVRSGAAPPPAQSLLYTALEVYQAITSSGVPLNAPGLR